jgi:hypothetical protein
MANTAHQLVAITKTILTAAQSLVEHALGLVDAIADELPDDEPTPITATVTEDATDTTRMTAQVAWDNTGYGNVTIDWGVVDATDDEEPETGTASYLYATAGTYPITVTDQDDDTRTVTVDVTVPFTVTGA